MRLPHPVRARRERRMADTAKIARLFGDALTRALNGARPEVEYTVRHAPRPRPDQIEVKGYLRDGQPVYIDAVRLTGQRAYRIPMREWLVGGENPLDQLEIVLDYPVL